MGAGMTDQPGAIEMYIPDNLMFNYTEAVWLVMHKTAGFETAQDCARYFQAGSDGRGVSAHYIVGLDGTIVQCVPESRGAGANCCLEAGHASYLPTGVNLNLKTIAVEIIDPSTDNSTPMPNAQVAAVFRLAHDICVRHNIPMRAGDSSGGIIGHNDIAPINRSRCPGPTFPWGALFAYLQGGHMSGIPQGWKDDGHTLTAPNNVPVVFGFRGKILAEDWDPGNTPTAPEYHAAQVQLHNPGLGAGQVQVFRDKVLWYTAQKGVIDEPYIGLELKAAYDKIAALQAAAAPAPTGPDVKATVQSAIQLLDKLL
jgi:hypothetical protein